MKFFDSISHHEILHNGNYSFAKFIIFLVFAHIMYFIQFYTMSSRSHNMRQSLSDSDSSALLHFFFNIFTFCCLLFHPLLCVTLRELFSVVSSIANLRRWRHRATQNSTSEQPKWLDWWARLLWWWWLHWLKKSINKNNEKYLKIHSFRLKSTVKFALTFFGCCFRDQIIVHRRGLARVGTKRCVLLDRRGGLRWHDIGR